MKIKIRLILLVFLQETKNYVAKTFAMYYDKVQSGFYNEPNETIIITKGD